MHDDWPRGESRAVVRDEWSKVLREKEREIASLRTQLDQAYRDRDKAEMALDAARAKARSGGRVARRLAVALRKYGVHDEGQLSGGLCASYRGVACTCGLADVLAGAPAGEEGRG